MRIKLNCYIVFIPNLFQVIYKHEKATHVVLLTLLLIESVTKQFNININLFPPSFLIKSTNNIKFAQSEYNF